MATVLSDGRPITFDLYAVTHREYINFVSGKLSNDEDELFIARVTGLEVKDVQSLPLMDWKKIISGLYEAVRAPVEADPKSAS